MPSPWGSNSKHTGVSNYRLTHLRTCTINLLNISWAGVSSSVGSAAPHSARVGAQPACGVFPRTSALMAGQKQFITPPRAAAATELKLQTLRLSWTDHFQVTRLPRCSCHTGPCRAPGHKAFVSHISLMIGNSLHSASRTFPEFQWADSNSC